MTTRSPYFTVGERVVANGYPGHPYPDIRVGGPGVVITESGPTGLIWVRLDTGTRHPYLACELRAEPTV